jgi:hypothetical protein
MSLDLISIHATFEWLGQTHLFSAYLEPILNVKDPAIVVPLVQIDIPTWLEGDRVDAHVVVQF